MCVWHQLQLHIDVLYITVFTRMYWLNAGRQQNRELAYTMSIPALLSRNAYTLAGYPNQIILGYSVMTQGCHMRRYSMRCNTGQ